MLCLFKLWLLCEVCLLHSLPTVRRSARSASFKWSLAKYWKTSRARTIHFSTENTYESLRFLDQETLSMISNCVELGESTDFLSSANEISNALKQWENHLLVGVQPENVAWPSEPLLSEIRQTFATLELPQMTSRHPELIPSVSKGLLSLYFEYKSRVREVENREKVPKYIHTQSLYTRTLIHV